MVGQKLTKELQELIREEYNTNINFQETSEIARELNNTFDLLAEINHKNTNNMNKKD